MFAKVIYFNWDKARKEDGTYNVTGSVGRVRWTGELLEDRPDLYDYVGDVETTLGHIHTCDKAFREYNRVDEDDMVGLKIRSMCVGDVVVFADGRLFVVQGCGWREFVGHSLKFWARPKVEEQS